MTETVQQLLRSFQALSDAEKHEATVEFLRHLQQESAGTLPDEGLLEAADELFRELDAREADDAAGEAR